MVQQRTYTAVDSEIDFLSYLRIIGKRKWTAVIICSSVTVMSTLVSLRMPEVYEANCTIKVYQQSPTVGLTEFYMGYDPYFLSTEMELLRSRTTIGNVINKLGLSYEIKSVSKGLRNAIKSVKIAPNTKKSDLLIKFTDNEGNYKVIYNDRVVGLGVSGTEFEGSFGKILIDAPVAKKNQKISIIIHDFDKEVAEVASKIEVNRVKEVNMIELTIEGSDPENIAMLADAIADEYVETSLHEKKLLMTSTVKFIEDQLLRTEANLNTAEEELKDFKGRENVIDLPIETRNQIELLTGLESQLLKDSLDRQTTAMELNLLKSRRNEVIDRPPEEQSIRAIELSYFNDGGKLSDIDKRILDLQKEKAELMRTRTESHPDVKRLDDQIEELNREYVKAVDEMMEKGTLATSLTEYDYKTKNLEKTINEYQGYLSDLPEKELQLNRLTRRYQVNEKMYSLLLEELQEAKIREAMETADIRVVDYAQVPKKPISPDHLKNIGLGLVLGLLLGLGAVFALEFADTSITSIENAERVTRLPVIGIIPRIGENIAVMDRSRDSLKRSKIYFMTENQPKSPISESFRSLRTAIIASGVDVPISSLMVTSSGLSEGKTAIAVNLAVVFAQTGAPTLLIDSDLRRSRIHRIFDIAREPGLSELLIGQSLRKDCIRKTDVKNLSIIPSGIHPPNPSELLGSKKITDLIKDLNKRYEILIFDTPPVLAVTDAAVLSSITRGTLFVISAGKTDRFAVRRALRLLEQTQANILGVVLNQADLARSYGSYGYKYYGQYYREYLEDESG
jgi:capsular exopolysaccharide synthesis family protein